MERFIARGPMTLPSGRDARSGDTFEADEADMAEYVDAGLAERIVEMAKPARKSTPRNAQE